MAFILSMMAGEGALLVLEALLLKLPCNDEEHTIITAVVAVQSVFTHKM